MNQFSDEDKEEEKKPSRITELVAIGGFMVAILIAGTSLMSNTANIPLYWFHFSFIILIALAVFIPSVILYRPISEKVRKWNVRMKRNALARRKFIELQDLVESFMSASYSTFTVLEKMRGKFQQEIREKIGLLPVNLLQIYDRKDVQDPLFALRDRLKTSEVTFVEFTFLIGQLNIILGIHEKWLEVLSEFRKGIKDDAKASIEFKISEYIEREYEEAREKHNDFIKSYKKFCRMLNRELEEERFFKDYFSLAKKW